MTLTDIKNRPDRIGFGILMVVLSSLFTALQDATFKLASADVTLWQLYILRSVLLIPVFLIVAAIWGEGPAALRGSLRLWPMFRAVLFVLMFFTMYAAITVLPLSSLAAGLYTAPLFIAALSALLTGEAVAWRGWLAIGIGFAGVMMILQPGSESFTWLMLLPVLGGFFYAISAMVTRSKCRGIPPSTMALSLSIALLITGIAASTALYLWPPVPAYISASPFLLSSWHVMGPAEWGLVVMLAMLMFGIGLVLPAAYQSAPPVIIATFDYCYLIFATLLGFVLFSEVPDGLTIVGMLMIAGAGLMVMRGGQ